jgi:undecaprenyl-diphosphatase
MIEILQALLLGLVQGLTEFIPVSSSAHLIIVPWLLKPFTGIGDFGLSFDLALHLGTLVAVVIFFWNDWLRYIKAFFASVLGRRIAGDHDRLLAWLLIIGCIPGVVAGALGDSFIESFFHPEGDAPHRSVAMVLLALLMIALAGLLWLAERMAKHVRGLESMTVRDAVYIGLAQATAILPGVSRSGSTITMGLALGLKREEAARFSFLLGAPIIAGAAAKKLLDALQSGQLASEVGIFICGFLAAAIIGYLCIRYLLRYLQRNSTYPFSIYRVFVGVLIIVLVAAGFGT